MERDLDRRASLRQSHHETAFTYFIQDLTHTFPLPLSLTLALAITLILTLVLIVTLTLALTLSLPATLIPRRIAVCRASLRQSRYEEETCKGPTLAYRG